MVQPNMAISINRAANLISMRQIESAKTTSRPQWTREALQPDFRSMIEPLMAVLLLIRCQCQIKYIRLSDQTRRPEMMVLIKTSCIKAPSIRLHPLPIEATFLIERARGKWISLKHPREALVTVCSTRAAAGL